MEVESNGYEVHIFSSNPSSNMATLKIAALYLRKKANRSDLAVFLESKEIEFKDMHENANAVIVFDDDHSTHKVASDNFLSPDDPRISEMTKGLKNSNNQGAKFALRGLDHK